MKLGLTHINHVTYKPCKLVVYRNLAALKRHACAETISVRVYTGSGLA